MAVSNVWGAIYATLAADELYIEDAPADAVASVQRIRFSADGHKTAVVGAVQVG